MSAGDKKGNSDSASPRHHESKLEPVCKQKIALSSDFYTTLPMWSKASEVAKKTIDQSAAQLSNLSLALRNKRSLEAYAQGIQEEFRQIIIRSGSKLLKKRKPIKLCKISLKCDDCSIQMSIHHFWEMLA